jgi:hypothetical protein
MYAMTKKENFSPIKLMAHYWLTIPGLKRGAVTCTSWVTRITNGLGLLTLHTASLIIHSLVNLIFLERETEK